MKYLLKKARTKKERSWDQERINLGKTSNHPTFRELQRSRVASYRKKKKEGQGQTGKRGLGGEVTKEQRKRYEGKLVSDNPEAQILVIKVPSEYQGKVIKKRLVKKGSEEEERSKV